MFTLQPATYRVCGVLLVGVLGTALASVATANQVLFAGTATNSESGNVLSATALFSLTGTTLTITLTNPNVVPISIGMAIGRSTVIRAQ